MKYRKTLRLKRKNPEKVNVYPNQCVKNQLKNI